MNNDNNLLKNDTLIKNNIIVSTHGHLGVITLDRISHLNAISIDMIQGIRDQLEEWRNTEEIQAILINSNSPKAFCAGGDVRYLYDSYHSGEADYRDYFAAEYSMLATIRQFEKPILVFLDGYVMGGGFGLAQACHIRISSEKSRFAMPETAIGFFPDVGATHFLSRLAEIGTYLALTGDQISCSDALHLDLVDYHVPSEKLGELHTAIAEMPTLSEALIRLKISEFVTEPESSEIQSRADSIHLHFSSSHLEAIEQSLANEPDPKQQVWAEKTLHTLQQRPLIAKQVSLKLQQVGPNLSIEQCMQLERHLQDIWLEQGDFIEGVRALIVDKDKKPIWKVENKDFEQKLQKIWPVLNGQQLEEIY